MSCFGGRVSQDLYQNCCNSGCLCQFDGDMSSVTSQPIYVQKVFDAVEFHLQGMKSVNGQAFSPRLPQGYRIRRVIDIRCRRSFNPSNIEDEKNLKLDVNTSISGATFLQDKCGDAVTVVGADGTFSQKLLYAETSSCDDQCMGTPVFGTQNIYITGNVIVELDLLVCDSCNNESVFTVCADVNVANSCQPLVLTNFFEICMPSAIDTAFLPRFTEFCNSACESRLATNNYGRDLCVGPDGTITANLIIAVCVTCEKKIVVPVQLCVLSTGYLQAPLQHNAICQTFPSLFPEGVRASDSAASCSTCSENGSRNDGNGTGCSCGDTGTVSCGNGGTLCGCGCDDNHEEQTRDDDGCGCQSSKPSRPQPRR